MENLQNDQSPTVYEENILNRGIGWVKQVNHHQSEEQDHLTDDDDKNYFGEQNELGFHLFLYTVGGILILGFEIKSNSNCDVDCEGYPSGNIHDKLN
jgi:hypothetical protein